MASLSPGGYSPETLGGCRRSLVSISRAIPLLDLTPEGLATLADIRGWSAGTRYLYAQRAAAFTAWATGEGIMAADPFENARRPRQPRYRPRPITPGELDQLLAAVPDHVAAWATLAAYAGLRRAEIGRVKGRDLVRTLTGWELQVFGKGSKFDAVPAHPRVRALFRDAPRGHLFTTRTGRPYTANHLGEVASDAFRAAGVDCTLHQLRHLFGTSLYQRTRDVFMVKRAMRHERIASTEIYVAADTSWVADAVCAL